MSSVAPPISTSSTAISIQPPAVTVDRGASTTLAVQAVAPVEGLGSWTIDVTYDAAVVTPTACTTAANTNSLCNRTFAANTIRIAGTATNGLVGTTALANITFQGVAVGTLRPVTVTVRDVTDPTGAPLLAVTSNGTITVK